VARTRTHVGTVVEFDDDKGWGTVRDGDGVEHWFHCTAIADGSRTIDVGRAVTYEVVAGRRGRWEASGVRPT
jgi:cold shock CspA family protein